MTQLHDIKAPKTQINQIMPLKSITIILFIDKVKVRLLIFVYLLVLLCVWTIDSGRVSFWKFKALSAEYSGMKRRGDDGL